MAADSLRPGPRDVEAIVGRIDGNGLVVLQNGRVKGADDLVAEGQAVVRVHVHPILGDGTQVKRDGAVTMLSSSQGFSLVIVLHGAGWLRGSWARAGRGRAATRQDASDGGQQDHHRAITGKPAAQRAHDNA